MTATPYGYAARLVRLYLESPDTPATPSSADWETARELSDRIPLETMDLAIKIAFVRRRLRASQQPLPTIRSLSYFRTVALNLTPEEREPAYAEYIDTLYDRLRVNQRQQTDSSTAENCSASTRNVRPVASSKNLTEERRCSRRRGREPVGNPEGVFQGLWEGGRRPAFHRPAGDRPG